MVIYNMICCIFRFCREFYVSLIIIVCQKKTRKKEQKRKPWIFVSPAYGLICHEFEM